MTPRKRREFIGSDEARHIFGAAVINVERKRLAKVLKALRADVPSAAWEDAADRDAMEFPPGYRDPKTPHGTRMIVSMVSGRFTPPYNLRDEDGLDGMSEGQANFYRGPSSCGSVISFRDI